MTADLLLSLGAGLAAAASVAATGKYGRHIVALALSTNVANLPADIKEPLEPGWRWWPAAFGVATAIGAASAINSATCLAIVWVSIWTGVLATLDLRFRLLPTFVQFPLIVFGVLLAHYGPLRLDWLSPILTAGGLPLVFWALPRLMRGKGTVSEVGLGDLLLVSWLGATVGPQAIFAAALAVIAGAISVVAGVFERGVPFAVCVALGYPLSLWVLTLASVQ